MTATLEAPEKPEPVAMTRRHAAMHYGFGVLSAVATGLGFLAGWLLDLEGAGWVVIAGVVGNLLFCFRTYYLGSRGVDLTAIRD